MTGTSATHAIPGQGSPRPPWEIAAERFRDEEPGLEWLAARQAAARARLRQSGLPGTTSDDWRYTDLAGYSERWAALLASPASGAPAPESGPAALPRPAPADEETAIVLRDGLPETPLATGVAGVTINPLRQLPPDLRVRAEGVLGATDGDTADPLADLNMALLRDGLLIATGPDRSPGKALHVRLHGGSARNPAQSRLLVDLAPGSHLAVIIEYAGNDGSLANVVSQFRLARGSHLHLVRVQTLADDAMLLDTSSLELGEAASVTVTSVDLGSKLCRQAVSVALAGSGADATINGMLLADGRRHVDMQTRLEHRAPATTSRQFIRGIADGHGRGVFKGKIVVQPGAAGSNAALTNRNLLLAPTAEIDTRPELEIYVDDVRCSHGATTGQLDANALFYLRSRGLDPDVARQLLTSSFLRAGLDSIAVPGLRARLEAELDARLALQPGVTGPGVTA